jgi:hypothetical protein
MTYLTPTPDTRMTDSYSDGMSGWVLVTRGARSERVHWSVTHPEIQSQHAALDEARRRLVERSDDA